MLQDSNCGTPGKRQDHKTVKGSVAAREGHDTQAERRALPVSLPRTIRRSPAVDTCGNISVPTRPTSSTKQPRDVSMDSGAGGERGASQIVGNTPLWWDVDRGRLGGVGEISVPSWQFCCEHRTALKHKVFTKVLDVTTLGNSLLRNAGFT